MPQDVLNKFEWVDLTKTVLSNICIIVASVLSLKVPFLTQQLVNWCKKANPKSSSLRWSPKIRPQQKHFNIITAQEKVQSKKKLQFVILLKENRRISSLS